MGQIVHLRTPYTEAVTASLKEDPSFLPLLVESRLSSPMPDSVLAEILVNMERIGSSHPHLVVVKPKPTRPKPKPAWWRVVKREVMRRAAEREQLGR